MVSVTVLFSQECIEKLCILPFISFDDTKPVNSIAFFEEVAQSQSIFDYFVRMICRMYDVLFVYFFHLKNWW